MKKGILKSRKHLRPISNKQAVEIVNRQNMRRELYEEYGDHCMTCKDRNRDWRGISLSHIIALSQGGNTTRKNCILECLPCHERYEIHAEKRPEFQQPRVRQLCDIYGIAYRGDYE